jgi:hypothetical protein
MESVPVAITTGSEEGGASEHCADKRRLLDEYHSATSGFLTALTLLNERMGTSSKERTMRFGGLSTSSASTPNRRGWRLNVTWLSTNVELGRVRSLEVVGWVRR